MSLKTEIDRTETEKNKTKQVAINIDNKLVELGGQRATNLADVPNEIQLLIGGCSKIARGSCYLDFYSGRLQEKIINTNVSFNVKNIFLKIERGDRKWFGSFHHSLGQYQDFYFKSDDGWSVPMVIFKTEILNNKNIKITAMDMSEDFRILEWIAIG